MAGLGVVLGAIYALSAIVLVLAGCLWKLSRRFRSSLIGEQFTRR